MNGFPRVATIASATIIVALLAGGLIFLGGSRAPSVRPPISNPAPTTEPAGPTTDPSAFPDEADSSLLGMLPADMREGCVRRADQPIGLVTPTAALRCTWGGMTFDVDQLDHAGGPASDAVQRLATERGIPPGDCEVATPASGRWRQATREVGSVACFLDGVAAIVEWTYDDEALLIRAAIPWSDVKSAVSWWIDNRDRIGPAQQGGVAPFPTTTESALISRLPASLDPAGCERGSYTRIATSLAVEPIASIRCPESSTGGATFLELRQISDDAGVTASDVVAAMNIASRGCPPPARSDGRWGIGDREMGALICWRDGRPTAHVDWSYDDDRILARASTLGFELQPVFDWWLQNAPLLARP